MTWAFRISVGRILRPVLTQSPGPSRPSVSSSGIWSYYCDCVRISCCFLIWGPTVSPLDLLGAVGTSGSLISPPEPQFPHRRTIKAVFVARVRTRKENTHRA